MRLQFRHPLQGFYVCQPEPVSTGGEYVAPHENVALPMCVAHVRVGMWGGHSNHNTLLARGMDMGQQGDASHRRHTRPWTG